MIGKKHLIQNILLLLFLILFSSVIIAQENRRITTIEKPKDTTVLDLVAKEGEVSEYKVSNVRRLYSEEEIQKDMTFDFIFKEKVISKNNRSSSIEWQLNQEVFKHQIFTLPTFPKLKSENHPFKIKFEIGHQGELLNIINCEEVRSYIIKMYELNDSIVQNIKSEKGKHAKTYGYHYKKLYEEDSLCMHTKNIFKMILFDVYSGLQGVPFSKDKSTYVHVQDTSSVLNHYWRTNGYHHIKTSQVSDDMYKIEDKYFDRFPVAIERYVSEKSSKEKESESINKKAVESFLEIAMANIYELAKKEGYSEKQVDSIITEFENLEKTPLEKKKYEFYKPFTPKKRYVIYNTKKQRAEKIYVEINTDLSDVELNYIKLRHRTMTIEKLEIR